MSQGLAKSNIVHTKALLNSDKVVRALESLAVTKGAPHIIQVTLNAMLRSPKLAECSAASVGGAILMAAQLDLPPDGVVAALVPYWNSKKRVGEAQFQPMYKGLVQLMYRSGMVTVVRSGKVYEGDEFAYERGLDQKLQHRPKDNAERTQQTLTHVWAMYETTQKGRDFKVLDKERIEYHKAFSKQQTNWVKFYAEMAEKSALIELAKSGPFSVAVRSAVEMDDLANRGVDQQLTKSFGDLDIDEDFLETFEPAEVEPLTKQEEDTLTQAERDAIARGEGPPV